MKRYLVDTNICVNLLRGKKSLYEMKRIMHDCFISELTVAELKYGDEYGRLKGGANYKNQGLSDLLRLMKVLSINSAIDLYAKEKARLRHEGKPIGDDFDLLIGCTAVANNMVLITENVKDFERINGIKVENWTQQQTK